jgi:hypothetical protein
VTVCPACQFDSTAPVQVVGELTIQTSWPSQNQLGGNARGSAGWHYRRIRQDFSAALHAALAAVSVAAASLKRRAWLKRVYRPGKRRYDDANLRGGGKPLIDVLVNRGLLVDDSPQWFEGIYSQEPGPADAIHIRLEDMLLQHDAR